MKREENNLDKSLSVGAFVSQSGSAAALRNKHLSVNKEKSLHSGLLLGRFSEEQHLGTDASC